MIPEHLHTVAVIAPAGKLADDVFAAGIARLEAYGKRIRIMPHARGPSPVRYLAATAEERAADLSAAWLDPEVDLILCARGGFGTAHVLELLDWEKLAARPDLPLIGYSDVTALHFAMEKYRIGIPICGPMLGKLDVAENDPFTQLHFRAALEAAPREIGIDEVKVLVPGTATGLPLVGNLTVAATLCGTEFLPDAAGRIVVLEDLNEPIYKLDRYLTQLRQAGFFDGAAAVAFGRFSDCAPEEELEALFRRFAAGIAGPTVMNFPFGHTFPLLSLNFRQQMELDTAHSIRFI